MSRVSFGAVSPASNWGLRPRPLPPKGTVHAQLGGCQRMHLSTPAHNSTIVFEWCVG